MLRSFTAVTSPNFLVTWSSSTPAMRVPPIDLSPIGRSCAQDNRSPAARLLHRIGYRRLTLGASQRLREGRQRRQRLHMAVLAVRADEPPSGAEDARSGPPQGCERPFFAILIVSVGRVGVVGFRAMNRAALLTLTREEPVEP